MRTVPLVQFDIVIDGGLMHDKPDKVGVAKRAARMKTQGTANRTPQELEDNLRSRNILGTAATVKPITIDDLKQYYRDKRSPSVARIQVIGALPKTDVAGSSGALGRVLSGCGSAW